MCETREKREVLSSSRNRKYVYGGLPEEWLKEETETKSGKVIEKRGK